MESQYNIEAALESIKPQKAIKQVVIAIIVTYVLAILFGMVYYYFQKVWLLMGAIPGVIIGYIFSRVDIKNRTILSLFCVLCTVLTLSLGSFFASIGFGIGEFPYQYLLNVFQLPWSYFPELAFPEFYEGNLMDIFLSIVVYGLGIICAYGAARIASDLDKSKGNETE